ncbi:MAG: NUDIX hydrolase [Simkaniaceae bacterium]
MKNREREAAIGICFNKSRDQVLLVKRRDIPVWVPPGGGIDKDEAPEKAVLREILEETGFVAKIIRKVGEYRPKNRLSRPTHLFECEIISGAERLNEESSAIGFHSLKNLPLPLAPPHLEWIEEAFQNQSELILRDITSVSYFTLLRALVLHPLITIKFLLTRLGIHINR